MLMIIEILFLIAGIWLIASGQIPNPLFRLLFGKGNYQLSSANSRLWGLLLASPLPIGLISADFEVLYLIVVAVVSIFIARQSRQQSQQKAEDSK